MTCIGISGYSANKGFPIHQRSVDNTATNTTVENDNVKTEGGANLKHQKFMGRITVYYCKDYRETFF